MNSFQRHLLSERSPHILYLKSFPCMQTNIDLTEKKNTFQRLLLKARDLSSLNMDCTKFVSRLHTYIAPSSTRNSKDALQQTRLGRSVQTMAKSRDKWVSNCACGSTVHLNDYSIDEVLSPYKHYLSLECRPSSTDPQIGIYSLSCHLRTQSSIYTGVSALEKLILK